MTLRPFLNKHAGQSAWVFGKGPSLAGFNFDKAGPLRCAINDVAAHVPGCTYCFANDGVARWRDVYAAGQILFQPERCLGEFDSTKPGAVACEVVTFLDCYDDDRLRLPREQLAELLTVRRGTLGSVLQILHIMGVSTVFAVGIDGGGEHAPGFDWRTRLRNGHGKEYNAIRSDAIAQVELMGMTLRFHNQKSDMTDDGKIWVKFNKSCFAEGVPYPQNAIAKLNPRVARELVAMRAASTVDGPQEKPVPEVETAESPMPSVENAMVPTKKRGRKAR